MSLELKTPNLPESVASAVIAAWHKKPGDLIKKDENLVDLETDKVMLEVPAPADGVLVSLVKNIGDSVTSGELLAMIDTNVSAQSSAPVVAEKTAESPNNTSTSSAAQAGPAARRALAESGLDANSVAGSGRDGRVTKADVSAAQNTAKPAQTTQISAPIQLPAGARPEERVPMTRIRARIAERLLQAQSTAAMLTTFNEVDLFEVNRLRAKYKDVFEKQYGVKLGFMGFFTKAVIESLKKYPILNASVDNNDIIYHGYYDIGIAVSSPRGLVVPILRDADQYDIAGIEKAIGQLGTKAKDNKLTVDDLTGGTFSITNGGVFGSMMSTPILNPPQSGILGMHGITERPMVVGGEIKIRPMMYLALTYDHRIIDGKEAVLFLRGIKEALEEPARLILGV